VQQKEQPNLSMKYRKQSKYSSCQLIAAINALIFLGKPDISDELFEELVDLTKCRHGGAICIEKAYPILGLTHEDNPHLDPLWVLENLPVNQSTIPASVFIPSLLTK